MSATDTTPTDFHTLAAKVGNPPVIVFSKPACHQCKGTYASLEKKGIRYEIIDVTEDEEALAHVLALGYAQMPVVETATDHWSGLRPDKLMTLTAALAAA